MDTDVAPFLTIEEAARLLRIGRTKAYSMAREWRETGGRSGLPVVDLGDALRVSSHALEQHFGARLTGALAPVEAAGGEARPGPAPSPPLNPPGDGAPPAAQGQPVPRNRRQQPRSTNQLNLFESLPVRDRQQAPHA